MNILVINEYAGSPYHGMTYRHYYLAKKWVELGHTVTICSGSYSHMFKEYPKTKGMFTSEMIDGIHYIWIKVLSYTHAHDKRRVLKWFEFTIKLLFLDIKKIQPDIILCSPTAPFSFFSAWCLAKRIGCKTVFEIRDIWPLTLIELGKYSRRHPFIIFMGWFEQFALNHADSIVSNLSGYKDYLSHRNIKRSVAYVPNGVVLRDAPYSTKKPLIKSDGRFILGYTGTLGLGDAMEYLIQAVKLLSREDLRVVIVGKGKNEQHLKKMSEGISGIEFYDYVNKTEIPAILQVCDACYIGWMNSPIYHYGVASNKLFDYMLSGKPIVYAINSKYDVTKESGCAVQAESENAESIAYAIKHLMDMPESERIEMGNRGAEYVKKHHTYKRLAEQYIKVLSTTIKNP